MSPVDRRPFDLARIARETFVSDVEFHHSIGSTNSRGMELAVVPEARVPLLILAESQTAGRGRGANRWWSAPGSLLFSLVLDLNPDEMRPDSWPSIALAAAVGICDALELIAPDVSLGIRWPNDVYCGPQKLCGILPELCYGSRPRLVLGVGINVNNPAEIAPESLVTTATSLWDLTERRHDLNDVLIRVLGHINARLQDLAAGAPALADSWSSRCLLRGRSVRLRQETNEVLGVCGGISETGALQLRTAEGVAQFYGGVIAEVSDAHEPAGIASREPSL